ncbi:MAG: glycosyltransferase family 2 protein [Patescibacteria group bacterium]
MRVSVVLPAIDETRSLLETVTVVEEKLKKHEVTYVIVTSPKLTTKGCRNAIRNLTDTYGSAIDHFEQSLPGVGGALQEAFARADGEVVVLMTSDQETPPQVVGEMVAKIEEGYDMATATRWRKGIAFNGYPPIKLLLNFCYQQVFRILYLTRLSDLTYGYRAMRGDKLHAIKWEELRHPFFFETLLKPLRLGYRIAEVDAPWALFTTRKADRHRGKTDDLLSYIKKIGIPYTLMGLRIRFTSRRHLLSTGSMVSPNPQSVPRVIPEKTKDNTSTIR